jgi:hypothetical protein
MFFESIKFLCLLDRVISWWLVGWLVGWLAAWISQRFFLQRLVKAHENLQTVNIQISFAIPQNLWSMLDKTTLLVTSVM